MTVTTIGQPPRFLPAPHYDPIDEAADRRAEAFRATMATRRSIRHFSEEPVPFAAVERAIATAATAPSGANSQPWRFIVVSDAETKRRLRIASEQIEQLFYGERATPDWLAALRPIGTNWVKPFLEGAPYLIVVQELRRQAERGRSYYAKESVGIAVGLLLASLHLSGLATLTYTSAPFRWVNEVLDRPQEEHPFVIVPVGLPAEGAQVPDLPRKSRDEVMTLHDPAAGT